MRTLQRSLPALRAGAQAVDAERVAPGEEPISRDAAEPRLLERADRRVRAQRGERPVESGILPALLQGSREHRGAPHRGPGARVGRDSFQMDELREERRGALLAEAGQSGDAVRVVADEREQVGDAGWSDATTLAQCLLVDDGLRAPVDLHDVSSRDALPEVLVRGEDPDLLDFRGVPRGASRERVVGLEVAHRPDRHPERAHRLLGRIELRKKLRWNPFFRLVAVEQIVPEAADRIVERDRDVGHRLPVVVQEREHRGGERHGSLLVAAVRSDVRRSFRIVGAEQLIGAVHQVQPHGATLPGEQRRDRSAQALAHRQGTFERDSIEIRARGPVDEVVVARAQVVDEAEIQASPREPVLSRRHLCKVELRAVRLDELLEQMVRVLELLLELLAAALGDFTEHAHRPLELAGGHLLEVDVVLLQESMEVRHLRDDSDRSDDGEGRRQDLIRDARHHVAAARGDPIDADGDLDRLVAKAHELRGGETVMRHRAPCALQPDHHLVLLARDRADRGHLLAQVADRGGEEVALEFEDEDIRLLRVLVDLLPGLAQPAQLFLAQELVPDGVAEVLDPLVEPLDAQPRPGRTLAPHDGDAEEDGEGDGREDDEALGGEREYVLEDIHGGFLADPGHLVEGRVRRHVAEMQHLQEGHRLRDAVPQVRRLDLQSQALPALLLLGGMLGRPQPGSEPPQPGLHGARGAEGAVTVLERWRARAYTAAPNRKSVAPGGNMLRIAFAFAVLAASHAAVAADPPPIRIGQVIPITGEAAESGRYHKYGAELAVEQVNKSGGIKGRRIELVQEDDKTTNPGAVAALQRLLEDKDIPAIVGSIRSTQVQAMLPTVKEAGIPFLIGGTNFGLTHQGNPWVFRFRPHDGFSAKVIGRFAVEELKVKKLALVHSTDAFGNGGRDFVVKALSEMKVEPVLVQGFNNGEKDFAAILTALKQSGADGLITYFTFSTDIGIFAKQNKQLGIKVQWIGSPSIAAV